MSKRKKIYRRKSVTKKRATTTTQMRVHPAGDSASKNAQASEIGTKERNATMKAKIVVNVWCKHTHSENGMNIFWMVFILFCSSLLLSSSSFRHKIIFCLKMISEPNSIWNQWRWQRWRPDQCKNYTRNFSIRAQNKNKLADWQQNCQVHKCTHARARTL